MKKINLSLSLFSVSFFAKMSFYLKPPRGDIHMEKLEELTVKRWRFLQLLDLKDINQFHQTLVDHANLSDSVMENSSKDRVSHFFLRLCISKSVDYSLKSNYIEKETSLFTYRLQQMSKRDITKSIRDVLRHLNDLTNQETCDKILNVLAKSLECILHQNMLEEEDGNDFEFQVPFQVVPQLVCRRKVVLNLGQASVHCDNVKEYLSCVFSTLLRSSITKMSRQTISYGFEEDDDRIKMLADAVENQIISVYDSSSHMNSISRIRFEQIEELSKHFPPCFAHVHQKLQASHRLGHHARIAYTLYLKDIGLPLEESLKFWNFYYSKDTNHHDKSKCTHSWQENGRKFEYSINHLYGNAGSGTVYSAHNCSSIAKRCSNINDELNCPLYDIEDLTQDHRKACLQTLKIPLLDIEMISNPPQYFKLSRTLCHD